MDDYQVLEYIYLKIKECDMQKDDYFSIVDLINEYGHFDFFMHYPKLVEIKISYVDERYELLLKAIKIYFGY